MMKLGTKEVTEVWFLPKNQEAYSPRVIQECESVDAARNYINDVTNGYAGELEMVRVTTHRQLVT